MAGPSIPGYDNRPRESGDIRDTHDDGVPILALVDDLSPIVDQLHVSDSILNVDDNDECGQNDDGNQCNQKAISRTVPWTTKMYMP